MSHAEMIERVLALGREIDESYWESFAPASEEEVLEVEAKLAVKLPADFREFYLRVGWNREGLPGGGGIFSPEDLAEGCSTNIFFVTGSMTPGKEWATKEEHEALWISNGANNPNPDQFTDDVLDFHGIPLWHLLAVGYDGIGSTVNIYTGDADPPFRFCAIHQSELYYTADSFLEGMMKHLRSEIGEDPEN